MDLTSSGVRRFCSVTPATTPTLRTARIRVGVAHRAGDPVEKGSVLEIDPSDASRKISAAVVRFSHFYLSATDDAEHEERLEILFETCRRVGVSAATVSVPSALHAMPYLKMRMRALLSRANAENLAFFFDFGKNVRPMAIDREHCVSDPLWFRGEAWSVYWRIHGWHPERWVRRYPAEDLDFLAKLARKTPPEFIILAHSERRAQWKELEAMTFPK